MNMFRLRLVLRTLKRTLNKVIYGRHKVNYNNSTLLFLESAMENMYGVDLNVPQHGHKEVQLKRFFINFLVAETDWSVMEISRRFNSAGIIANGLSRRTMQYYVNSHADELKEISPNSVTYARAYRTFTKTLISIL
jgi:hypothetical protein